MATRHQARTAVIGLLYAYDLGNENISKFTDEILEEGKIRNKQREFSHNLFNGTLENLEVLDKEIQSHLKDWDYSAIGKVEKAIMRLGAYEILIVKTDKAIIINECVELAKTLADEKAPQFINGVLDALGKEKKVEVAVEEVEVVEVEKIEEISIEEKE
ncbi:Transcription termination protein NusB [hydrothermal vent metagenome]|uniref:Transcription termination protein NusB n=1 Tax=hydrothermal vent metagenome TaxID=652676 RepID=A0A1W1D081_9ZZZZ